MFQDGAGALILQEVRSIVCSYIHQAFLKDTTLAKLVHFQVSKLCHLHKVTQFMKVPIYLMH